MKINYSYLLKDPRWQKKRLEILHRDGFKCKLCGDTKAQLQVHHKKYENSILPWDYPNGDLITLCVHCHEAATLSKSDGGLKVLNSYNLITGTDGTFIKLYYRDDKENVAFWIFKNNKIQDSFLVSLSEIKTLLKVMCHE